MQFLLDIFKSVSSRKETPHSIYINLPAKVHPFIPSHYGRSLTNGIIMVAKSDNTATNGMLMNWVINGFRLQETFYMYKNGLRRFYIFKNP